MTDFPTPPKGFRVHELSLALCATDDKSGAGTFRLHIDDQGGGCYPVLDLHDSQDQNNPGEPSRVAFDPPELVALAQWAADLCRWVDEQGEA